MKKKNTARKKKFSRTDIIVFAVLAVVAVTVIALLIFRDIANANPCDRNCTMHPPMGICHCHGTCGTPGCRCHGADAHN